MTAEERNATARNIANRDPVAVADFSLRSEMLSDTLQERFDTMEPAPVWQEEEDYSAWVERVRADADRQREAAIGQTPEWRAVQVNDLLFRWELSKRSQAVLQRWVPHYAQTAPNLPKTLVDHLAMLPESAVSTSGLSLLTVVVEAMPTPVVWDSRRHVNLPGPMAATRHTAPIAHELRNGQIALPFDFDLCQRPQLPPDDAPRFEIAYLPGMDQPDSKLVPTPLLDLWDGGNARGSGGPVPVAQRMGWELLLAPRPDDFYAGTADLSIANGELASLLWPALADESGGEKYRSDRHGRAMREAARWLNDPDNAVLWRANSDDRPTSVVLWYKAPTHPFHFNDRISAYVRVPNGRRIGPQIDNRLRRRLAATSYRQHRIYVSACCLWDRYATFNGRLVPLTLPEVIRNDAGYVIDAKGNVITQKGRPSRRSTHPRAVHTGKRLPNPNVDTAYPWIEGEDVILLANHRVGDKREKRKAQRQHTLTSLRALRDRVTGSALDFEMRFRRVRGGREWEAVRLLPSTAHFAAHSERYRRNRLAKRQQAAR